MQPDLAMDHDRRHGHHYVNGMTRPVERKKEHNYKLVVDPFLHKGHSQKVYRFDGVLPGENRVVSVRDPRSRITRLWTRQQQADLPVPKFKYDEFYVGIPPPKEVTFTNLNDNINKDFLENMCKGFGKMEEIKIYFHPKTKKHMGIGKILFCSSKAAKACVDKLNQTSKMGNIMNVFIDTMGRERNRMIEELTTERPKPSSTSSGPVETVYPETEAYDPGDTFDMGMGPPEQDYTPSVETDYSGYSEGGYSVPQSEMSLSSQDTGYSSGNNAMGMGYPPREDYNQYPVEHHPPPGNKYYHRQQYGSGQQHLHHQQHHHQRHHQPPATPAHHHPPPQTPHSASTPHYAVLGDMNNSRYGFYVPPPSPNTPFDRPPPPLPPEPVLGIRPDHNFQDPRSYHGERSRHNQSKQKRRQERELKLPPPKPPTPEPESDEPRFESLESRIQSLLNVHGMGSPDHCSSSSQDEATPSHASAQESSFEYHQPPAAEPLPPMPEHPPECEENMNRMSRIRTEMRISPIGYPGMGEQTNSQDQFEGLISDSQTVIEETVNTEVEQCATPTVNSVYDGTPRETTAEGVNTPDVSITPKPTDGAGANEEDDRMSLSSISSGEEKLEINAPLPATGTSSSSPAPTNFSQSPMQSVPSSSPAKVVTSSWQNTALTSNSAYGGLMSSPPVGFGGMTVPGYQGNVYSISGFSPGSGTIGSQVDGNDPSDQTFSTVLDKFIKELKQVVQKDLCKKMVENSAFKSFENWWDMEVEKTKQPQKVTAEEIPTVVPTITKTKPEVKTELSASLASLFGSKERPGLDTGMGYGGFLGIRGGMPKMPSFKRKFRPPSPPPEEDEDSRKPDFKSADEDSDREEITGPKIKKPVISESDESDESSDEEKDEESGDEEDEDFEEEGSEESSEEESEDEEEESDESDQEDESDEEDEVKATTSDLVDKGSLAVEKEKESPMEVETVKKSDEDADVDVVSSGDEDKSLHTDKDTDTSRDGNDSEVSSMDTDDDASPSKDSPGKRPLSPIMEEREKEELETKKDTSESESKGHTTTTTASEITDSSAMDSDSSAALPPGRVRSKVVKIVKVLPSDSAGKELRPSDASPVLKDLIQRGPLTTDRSSCDESEQEMPSASVLTDGEEVGNEEEVEASSNKMSLSESEAEQRSNFMVPAIAEHDYFTFRPMEKEDSGADSDRTESADEDSEPLSEHLMDHNYSLPPLVEQVRQTQLAAKLEEAKAKEEAKDAKKKAKPKKSRNSTLSDITNKADKKISRELVNLLPPVVKPIPKFKCRTIQEEREIFFDIYNRGIAEEDVRYLKRTYDELIQSDDPNFFWLNDILWVDHTQTDIPDILPVSPPKKKKVPTATLR